MSNNNKGVPVATSGNQQWENYWEPEYLLPTGLLGKRWWVRYPVSLLLLLAAMLVVNDGMPFLVVAIGLVLLAATQAKEVFFLSTIVYFTVLYAAASMGHSFEALVAAGIIMVGITLWLRPKIQDEIQAIKSIPAMWSELTTYRRLGSSPVISAGREAIIRYWLSNTQTTRFSRESQGDIARQLMSEVLLVAKAQNSFLENRKTLAWAVNELAMMQVLVIQPEPKDDPSHLRGSPGISGNLSSSMADLCDQNHYLKSWIHNNGLSNLQEIQEAIVLRHLVANAMANIFNHVRKAVGDMPPTQQKDWFPTYLYIQCAIWESVFRKDLGLSLDLTEEALGVMREVEATVMSGAKPPIII